MRIGNGKKAFRKLVSINTCSCGFLSRFPEHSSYIIVQYNSSKSLLYLFFSSKKDMLLEYIYIGQQIIVVHFLLKHYNLHFYKYI